MNFSQLKFIKATAELKSFSKAAQFCFVTQPTLSNAISKLEEELKEKIFERTTRNVNLTTFGELILPTILKTLHDQEKIYNQARLFNSADTNLIRLGTSPLLNSHCISSLVASYKEQADNYDIILIEENFEILEQKLLNKELDIILVPAITKSTNINSIHLYQEELFLIDNKHSADVEVQLNDIRNETYVMVPDSCGLSNITRTLLRTTSTEAKEYQGKALSYQVLADWAANGLGCAILPKSKIPSHHSKKQILKSGKAIKITFEAKWLKQDKSEIDHLIDHFNTNKERFFKNIS